MTRRRLTFLALAVLLLAGCRGGPLGGLADDASRARLDALPEESPLLLSLHGAGLPGDLPGVKPLGSAGDAHLVVAPRSFLDGLDALPALQRVVVWGDDRIVGRLDPLLRLDLLNRLETPGADLSAVATFAGDAPAAAALGDLGLAVGSVTGGVATVGGPPAALLDLLARDDLRRLEKPALQLPSSATPNTQRIEP